MRRLKDRIKQNMKQQRCTNLLIRNLESFNICNELNYYVGNTKSGVL